MRTTHLPKGTIMFKRKVRYQYGSNPKNVIRIPVKWAEVVNKFDFIEESVSSAGKIYGRINLTREELKTYNKAASYLNKYIKSKGGGIDCEGDYLDHNDILTRIK